MKKIINSYKANEITKAELIREIFTRISNKISDYTKVIGETRRSLIDEEIPVRYSELYSATKNMWEPA